MKHKHYDVLVAWLADQTLELEYFSDELNWTVVRKGTLNPIHMPEYEWRIKPRMVKVGRHEWPMPLDAAPEKAPVWAWSFEYDALQTLQSKTLKQRAVDCGLAHLTKEAAQQHADALVCINRGDV